MRRPLVLLFMQRQKATGNQSADSASSGERSKFILDWLSVIRSIGPFVCCIDFVEEKHVKIVDVGQLLKHLIILYSSLFCSNSESIIF